MNNSCYLVTERELVVQTTSGDAELVAVDAKSGDIKTGSGDVDIRCK